MPRSFNLKNANWKWKGVAIRDPRVAMRAVIGLLLAANLAAAVIAFKPFGGSADDLRQQQQSLSVQLRQLQMRLASGKRLVDKVEVARSEGDQFLAEYFLDERVMSATLLDELNQMAVKAGIRMGQSSAQAQPIEGSDTLYMLSIQAGFEGTYPNLAKFVNLVDKSPRFLIIENMQANAPTGPGAGQGGGQALNVTLKIDTFVRGEAGPLS
jgi:Tfp pilus assembly protein PilO